MELVLVMPPGGAPFRAARKRMPTGIAHTTVLADEVAALRVAQGCRHAVQLLDVRSTDAHHELLFELMEGGTLEEEVVGAGAGTEGCGLDPGSWGTATCWGLWKRRRASCFAVAYT